MYNYSSYITLYINTHLLNIFDKENFSFTYLNSLDTKILQHTVSEYIQWGWKYTHQPRYHNIAEDQELF